MLRKTLAALAVAAAFGPAQAALLTFDDVPGGSTQNNYGVMPSYMGFTFGCAAPCARGLDWIDTVGSSWNYGAVSGEFALLNNAGGDGIVRAADGSDFSFDGLWSRTWDAYNSPRTVSIVGLNNGQTVWTVTGTLSTAWSFFGGATGAIDELRLNLGSYFLVDNLALNERGQAVPEPTSLLLAGLGLAALGASRRTRRKA
jgi:hypothetical protein